MKRIKFSISKQGVTTIVDAQGYGDGCRSATANLESRLGVANESTRENTESLYEQTTGQEVAAG